MAREKGPARHSKLSVGISRRATLGPFPAGLFVAAVGDGSNTRESGMADHTCQQTNLDEILADPIIMLMMQSDGVDPDDVRQLLRETQAARLAKAETARPN